MMALLGHTISAAVRIATFHLDKPRFLTFSLSLFLSPSPSPSLTAGYAGVDGSGGCCHSRSSRTSTEAKRNYFPEIQSQEKSNKYDTHTHKINVIGSEKMYLIERGCIIQ